MDQAETKPEWAREQMEKLRHAEAGTKRRRGEIEAMRASVKQLNEDRHEATEDMEKLREESKKKGHCGGRDD